MTQQSLMLNNTDVVNAVIELYMIDLLPNNCVMLRIEVALAEIAHRDMCALRLTDKR